MNTRNTVPPVRRRSLALACLLTCIAASAMPPVAGADEVTDLTVPTNSIDLGVGVTNHSSDLFGQYNGLQDSGAHLLAGFGLRGGDAWGQAAGTHTWSLTGSDLGTTSRSLSGTLANQGTWSLGLDYDQLRNYGGDSLTTNPGSFTTPLLGSGNVLTLPPGFGSVANTQNLTPAQKSFFHTDSIYTERDTSRVTASHQLGTDWNIDIGWTNIRQSGSMLLPGMSDALTKAAGAPAPTGQDSLALAYPTDYDTNNYHVGLNWTGERGFGTVRFSGSSFTDNNNGVWFANPFSSGANTAGVYPLDMEGTPPSNQDNTLGFSGGWNFTPKTQLVGGASYGRNTQNMAYSYEPAQLGTSATNNGLAPLVSSLDGLVVDEHANWRLTHEASSDLTLSGGMIYTRRDDRTASYLYQFQPPETSGTSNWMDIVNAPMSNSKLDTDVAANYRISATQRVNVELQNEKVDRWCDNRAANVETVSGNGATYTTTGCAQVPQSRDNKLVAEYRIEPGDTLRLHAGLTYDSRDATLNPLYYSPVMATTLDGGTAGGFENPAWVAFFQSSRNEEAFRAGASWQASPAVDVSLDGTLASDQYTDTALGMRDGHRAEVNLQSDIHPSAKSTVSAYVSWQYDESDTLAASSSTSANYYDWTTSLRDIATTAGLSFRQGGLLADKLTLRADLSYSVDNSGYTSAVTAGYGTDANEAVTCQSGTAGAICGAVPVIRTEITQFNLAGDYSFDKSNAVVLGFLYQRVDTNDYMYLAEQFGYTPTGIMPINEQNPSYRVGMVYLRFRHSFQ